MDPIQLDRFCYPHRFRCMIRNRSLAFLILIFLSPCYAEENFPVPDPQDRFQCTKIPTQVDGVEYDKSLKCETKDAICYVIEGFAMSCVPKFPPSYDSGKSSSPTR